MTTTTNRLSTQLAAGALVAGIALLGAPAYAESMSAGDPADATASLYDIRKVSANHQDTKLVVEVKVTDLLLESDGGPASMSLFIDTDRSQAGPELRLGTGLQTGTDYQLVRMKNWRAVGEPLTCGHKVKLVADKDINDSGHWADPIVTTVEPVKNWSTAEDYHQDYLQKNPNGYTCHWLREWDPATTNKK